MDRQQYFWCLPLTGFYRRDGGLLGLIFLQSRLCSASERLFRRYRARHTNLVFQYGQTVHDTRIRPIVGDGIM